MCCGPHFTDTDTTARTDTQYWLRTGSVWWRIGLTIPWAKLNPRHCFRLEVAQIFGHVDGGRITFRSPFRQRLQANAVEFFWNLFIILTGGAWLEVRDLLAQVPERFPAKRPFADQKFVEDDPEAEEIRTPVNAMTFAACLFGTHVRRGPCETLRIAAVLLTQRQTEIGHERFSALIKQDVPRLDISMYNPLLVKIVQCLGHRRHQFHRFIECQSRLLHPFGKIGPFDVF